MARPITIVPGTGRPPVLATQLERAKDLARLLKTAMDQGLRELGQEYPQLLKAAITIAKGDKAAGVAPDTTMMRFLLEYLPRLMPPGDEEDTPMKQLLRGWQGDLHLHKHEGEVVIDPDTKPAR